MHSKSYPVELLQQTFVVAVCIHDFRNSKQIAKLQRNELCALIQSAGWIICGEVPFTLKKLPQQFLGNGQIEHIVEHILQAENQIQMEKDLAEAIDFVVIDYELSPTQLFDLEKRLSKQVVDRKALILTLFEQRAQTRESRLQVRLARLYYEKPRLKRAWTHLSRQRGGRYGTRGEGETQIEVDKRLIHKQIKKLESQINLVQQHRTQQRKRGSDLPHIALVGYTNAGKSALLQAIGFQGAYVADRLFATLDPKSCKLQLPNGQPVIVTDTVGFVRKLPHELIDAFRATLEETILADLQLLVLDASDEEWQEKLATVHRVLQELKIDEKDQILLLNKVDLLNEEQRQTIQILFPAALLISAKQRLGLDALWDLLSRHFAEHSELYFLEVPHEAGALRAWLFERKLISTELDISKNGQNFHLCLSPTNLQQLRQKFPQFLSSLQPL